MPRLSTVVAVGGSCYLACAAAGYRMAHKRVTSEHYLLVTIADASSLTLSDSKMVLQWDDPQDEPYWQVDLSHSGSDVQIADAVIRSGKASSLSANGEWLWTLTPDEAAETTPGTILNDSIETVPLGKWQEFATSMIKVASGFAVGYASAVHFSKPSEKDVEVALRRPRVIESVKKYVFLSLLHAKRVQRGAFDESVDSEPNQPKCSEAEADTTSERVAALVECVKGDSRASEAVDRAILSVRLIQSAQAAFGSDSSTLRGHEFLVFFLE